MKKHPAFSIFEKLFNEQAKDPGPVLPSYFVTPDTFYRECRNAGLTVPDGWVEAKEWEEEIGLPEFARKLIAKYHREHGSDFTPMEKGAWKLRLKCKRNGFKTGYSVL